MSRISYTPLFIALCAVSMPATQAFGMENCSAKSAATLTPVIELYTSEGCSSCPPAERWMSTLKDANQRGDVVAQAFHVNYWDYIGWVDRFAVPTYTTRQREMARASGQSGIYTPQLIKNGRDSRDYSGALGNPARAPASKAALAIQQTAPDRFEANVVPTDPKAAWSAYWTVTEHGHSSRVTAGENKGETLKHDFVVRQYSVAGAYTGASKLTLNTLPASAANPRQINLVVFDTKTGLPLQALSMGC